jgi:hypothetical protein
VASGRQPAVGEKWIYQYTDLWKPGEKGQFTAEVVEVRAGEEVIETISLAYAGRAAFRQIVWPHRLELREWDAGTNELAFREITPFALALGLITPDVAPEVNSRPLEEGAPTAWSTTVKVTPEAVSVPAGRFQATKVALRGQRVVTQGRISLFELTAWYAPEMKRYVKLTYDSYISIRGAGLDPWHRQMHELVSAPR